MKLQIFAVRDRASNSYGNPMFLPSIGYAIRSVADEVNKGTAETILKTHPEDFELYHLGEFETDTCRFVLLPDPKSIALCQNLKVNGSTSNG